MSDNKKTNGANAHKKQAREDRNEDQIPSKQTGTETGGEKIEKEANFRKNEKGPSKKEAYDKSKKETES